MRPSIAIAALLLLTLVTGARRPVPIQQEREVEQTISRQVRAYFAAMGAGKVADLEAALADDYLVIGGDGKLETRAERLTWLRANAKDLIAVTPREIRVRPYGNTAVATGLAVIPQGANAPPIEERFTQVWVRRGNDWKMVSAQITIVKKQ